MAARFVLRCANIQCKTQLYFVPWIPVQIAEKRQSYFCHLLEIPGTVNQEDYVNIVSQHPSALGIFRKPQLIFVFQGDNAPPHTFMLVEVSSMDIESAFPPHAVAPIFTRYEHNRNCVGLNNENIKCGSSALIEKLKQRVEQHCYKSAPGAMRRLYLEMPQHIHLLSRMRGYPTKYLSLISYEWIDTEFH